MSKIVNLDEANKKNKFHKKIIYVIFILINVYILCAIYLLSKNSTEGYIVEAGTITLDESAIGYIIRDETIVKGENYKNGIYQIVSEGERVSKNQTIFRYYGSNEEKISNDILEIDEKLHTALENQKDIFPNDIKNIEKQIDIKIQKLRKETDMQTINEYKKQISELLDKKAKIVGDLSPTGSYIKELTDKKQELQNELLRSSEYINATKSGVVSYKVDNLEDVLTVSDFSNLTEEKLESLDLKTGKLVPTNNECAKVIENFECYLVTVLNSESAQETTEGTIVNLTLASGSEVPAEIVGKYLQKNNKVLIVFKLKTLTDELISYRKISFNINWWTKSGLKIQNSSIIEDENGLKYVVRKKSGKYSKLLIKVLNKNEKYAIISTYDDIELESLNIDKSNYIKISMYDTILTYPNINKLKFIN